MNRYLPIIALCGLLVITAAVYWPGLYGPFLLDDFPNLNGLHLVDSSNYQSILDYVLSGFSGPTGRPISLLSFAFMAKAWPADPWSFKFVNLMLHLLNGILIAWMGWQLTRALDISQQRRAWLAAIVAGLWLLHPLNVSTVLYVVQRMVELTALFTLLGLLCYVHGRRRLVEKPAIGLTWMSTGITLFGLLAFFSKENGILIVLFALVIEYTICSFQKPSPLIWKRWASVFLFLPIIVITGWFILNVKGIDASYFHRDFTLGERLLTETRVMLDYLTHIFLPRLGGTGLYYDDYVISEGLLDPPQTLIAILILSGIILIAFFARSRVPVLSFGLLWFLAGHTLESTFLPLEIYFEHRNYLPMFGPLFAAVYYGAKLTNQFSIDRKPAIVLALFTIPVISLIAFITWEQAKVWGNELLLAENWVQENPASVRARQTAADEWIKRNQYQKAYQHIEIAYHHNPQDLGLKLQLVQLDCVIGNTQHIHTISKSLPLFKSSEFSTAVVPTLTKLINIKEKNQCEALKTQDIGRIIQALLKNPYYNQRKISLYTLYIAKSDLHLVERKLNPTIEAIDKAFALKPNIELPLRQARLLASAGLYDEALNYVQLAKETDQKEALFFQNLHTDKIKSLEAHILENKALLQRQTQETMLNKKNSDQRDRD